MAVKTVNFKIKGMQRDLSASAFNPNFAYENMNIRVTPDKENTLLSVTNEKGTGETNIQVEGTPIGLAILNDTAVIFSTNDVTDYIHKVTLSDSGLSKTTIYSGNLGFSYNHPIETLVYYESVDVQKVYWVDGNNQLRFVNIANGQLPSDYKFDFVETIDPNISVNISRDDSPTGQFPAGIIQYFITYYNKYGQESGIVYQSPMYYLAYSDRGATSEETCACLFKIEISNVDTSWDYLRLYSIHRTSINSTPAAYIVSDVRLESNNVTIMDIGSNEAIGDTDLLYKTKTPIIANTITQKYNTLFAGNVSTPEYNIDSLFPNEFNSSTGIRNGFTITEDRRSVDYYSPIGVYPYENELSKSYWNIVHFKGGDIYRIGIQCQNKYGQWSNPIYIGDYTIKSYPYIDSTSATKYVSYLKIDITDSNLLNTLRKSDIIAIRGLIAQPINGHKSIICQGVLCPTVYNINDRINNNIWGVSSWFFRPFPLNNNDKNYNLEWRHDKPLGGASHPNGEIQCASGEESAFYDESVSLGNLIVVVQYILGLYIAYIYRGSTDNKIYTVSSSNYQAALTQLQSYVNDQVSISESEWKAGGTYTYNNPSLDSAKSSIASSNKSNYFVDQSTLTFNSPDINDSKIQYIKGKAWKVRIVGAIPITSNYTSYDLQSNGTLYNIGAVGKVSHDFSNPNISSKAFGLSSAGLWNDSSVNIGNKNFTSNYVVYPWHRSGALGDQSSQELEEGAIRYSTLSKKVISNLKYSYSTAYFNNSNNVTGSDNRYQLNLDTGINIFNSNELTVEVLNGSDGDYIYEGNVDTIVNKVLNGENTGYPIYFTGMDNVTAETFSNNAEVYGVEPISIKYKSTPHAVFRLAKSSSLQTVLPSLTIGTGSTYNSLNTGDYGIPLIDDIEYTYIVEGIVESSDGSYTFSSNDIGKYYFIHDTTGNIYHLALVDSDLRVEAGEYVNVTNGDSFVKSDFKHTYTIFGVGILGISSVAEVPLTYTSFTQDNINFSTSGYNILAQSGNSGMLYMAEMYLDTDEDLATILYGNTSTENLKTLQWNINGESVLLGTKSRLSLNIYGDTYYSRWDCMKTYAYTTEDENQVVEILSFMVESDVNLDGRTDRNRGQSNNNNMSPVNFNLYNEVYNQKDNYFQYRIVEDENSKLESTILWSTRKSAMEDIDSWTNLYLTSSMDVDSRYGGISRLFTINNNLLFFQTRALGQLMYNENAQIVTTQGTPVELGSTGTVTGYKYISDSIGLPDKWAFCNANSSAYFIDPYSSGIYQLSDSLKNLSDSLGYRTWINTHSSEITGWNPVDFSGYVLYYDKANSEVYIIGKEENSCLVYSELLQQFTSFYSYGGTPYFFNLKNRGFFLKNTNSTGVLWEQHEGDYNRFFGNLKPYWVTVIANPDPTKDKIFNNLEFRADILVDGKADNTPPFDRLTVWNEYQNGTLDLSFDKYKISNLKKKFRIWRALIPRDDSNHRDRIRNPWAYIKLSKGEQTQSTNKAILHDMTVYYFD